MVPSRIIINLLFRLIQVKRTLIGGERVSLPVSLTARQTAVLAPFDTRRPLG